MNETPTISTLGELRASGYRSRGVKAEMRANLVRMLRAGEPLLPGILGYDDSVLPQRSRSPGETSRPAAARRHYPGPWRAECCAR